MPSYPEPSLQKTARMSTIDVAEAIRLQEKWSDDLDKTITTILSALVRSFIEQHELPTALQKDPKTISIVANASVTMREQIDGPLADVRAWIANAMQIQHALLDELDIGALCIPDEGPDAERVITVNTNSRGSALPGQRASEAAMGPIDCSLWVKQETRVSGHPVPQNKYNTSGSAARAKKAGTKKAKLADGTGPGAPAEGEDEGTAESEDEDIEEEEEDDGEEEEGNEDDE